MFDSLLFGYRDNRIDRIQADLEQGLVCERQISLLYDDLIQLVSSPAEQLFDRVGEIRDRMAQCKLQQIQGLITLKKAATMATQRTVSQDDSVVS